MLKVGQADISELACPMSSSTWKSQQHGVITAFELVHNESRKALIYRVGVESLPGEYALKIISPEAEDRMEAIYDMQSEAAALAAVQHIPGIVRMFDSGWDRDDFFILMEFLHGESAAERLFRDAPDSALAYKIVRAVLNIETGIHEAGYLYRDLKAENIFLSDGGMIRLLDFGLSQPCDEAAAPSRSSVVLGSPHYIPPERLLGQGESFASELYSLGHLFYYLLTGRFLFQGSIQNVLAMHMRMHRYLLPTVWRGVPEDAIEVIEELTAHDKKQRFEGMEKLNALLCQTTVC